MATINLHTNYNVPLAKAFEFSSIIGGRTSSEYKWTGSNTIVATAIVTDALTNYNNSASSGRYGTPSEVEDAQQSMSLSRDRSFSKTVDKANYQEANFLKSGANVVHAYMNEQVGPEIEKYFLERMILNAGIVQTISAAPTTSTILGMLAGIEVNFDDNRVPKTDRYCAVPHKYIALFRQALTNCDDITDKLLLKGIVGKFGSLHILGVSESELPTDCYAVAWQKGSALFPKTIDDCKVSHDVPGISGMLVEARFRYDAFVLGKRCQGVIAVVKAAKKATTSVTVNGTTATVDDGDADYYKYTTDGSDPRYSNTATKVAASTTTFTIASGATAKVYGFTEDFDYFPSDVSSATAPLASAS